ncbi:MULTISPECIES: sugar transferase [unclassified Sulfitobacter]|uniref:sugar transferase n=1 Tax=unclassified Sulfitobacter TaxID=196795 RepID=UPI003747310B
MKRIIDILGASLGLLLLSPVVAIVAYKIRHEMGSPVMFRQTRPCRHGTPFQMIKLRTMRDALDANRHPLPDG